MITSIVSVYYFLINLTTSIISIPQQFPLMPFVVAAELRNIISAKHEYSDKVQRTVALFFSPKP